MCQELRCFLSIIKTLLECAIIIILISQMKTNMLKDLFNVPEVVNLQNKNATAQNPEYQKKKKKKISKSNSDFKISGYGMYSINVC